MDVTRLWLGLISFSVGLVLFFNQGNIFPNSGYNSPSGALLLSMIVFEILVLVMAFGGLVLMALSWDWGQAKEAPKAKAKVNQ